MTIKRDYFKTFCAVSKALGSTLKREELLDRIVEGAIAAMDGKAASLFLRREQDDLFVPVAQKGLSDNYLHADPYRARPLADQMVKDGYLAMADVETDPRAENKAAKKAEGLASILVVPVMAEDRIIGVLSLYTAEKRDFSEEEIDFLRALADQGGIAIQNSRLVDRLRKNATLFRGFAKNINASLDIKRILHILTADIADTFGLKGVNIRLLNKETGTLDLVASYGLSEAFLAKGPISSDRSVTNALRGETVAIQDARNDSRVQYPEAMEKEGIVSMLVVPISVGDEAIGVMRLCSDVEREFPESMVILMEALAQQGGIAIQNASMYLALQEDKQNLEEDIWSHRLWF
ncbi:MAG: GAF domain-containing protein [Desulfococcaceae bacterium]